MAKSKRFDESDPLLEKEDKQKASYTFDDDDFLNEEDDFSRRQRDSDKCSRRKKVRKDDFVE